MGQSNTKSAPLRHSSSSGPDPIIFRSRPSFPLPAAYPSSAAMQQAGTSDTFTRIDYSPAGELPLPKTMSKSRSMVRKLSQKAGFLRGDEGSKAGVKMSSAASEHVMTPENEFKLFEALIINGGAKSATIGEARLYPRKIIEAGTFKRSSSPGIPLPATAGPAHLRSSTYRRSSIKSVHSDRISIKSTHRAEKEWRARVAGLAGRKSTLSTLPVEIRGPVPPRRTPGPGRRSPSPEDDALQTPQQTEVEQGTPTKSIMSNRSFETLGHYAHLTSEVEDSPTHDRQDSIPQSVSLFFLDPNCPDGTRPSSLVAPSILTAIPPSPVQQKGSLPPFESFHSSPNSVDALGTYVGLSGEPTKQVRPSEPQPVFKIHDQSRQVQSSTMYPGTRRQGLTLDLMPFVPRPQNGNRFSQYNRTSPQTPSTPCSPTTSYILTAPVNSIRLTAESPYTPEYPYILEREHAHPYAIARGEWSSPAPHPPLTKSLIKPMYTVPVHSENNDDISFDPFTSPLPLVPRRILYPRIHVPTARKIRKSAPVAELLGSSRERKGAGADLTPGMETRNRSPKSGLPIAVRQRTGVIITKRDRLMTEQDTQRWLQATSDS